MLVVPGDMFMDDITDYAYMILSVKCLESKESKIRVESFTRRGKAGWVFHKYDLEKEWAYVKQWTRSGYEHVMLGQT